MIVPLNPPPGQAAVPSCPAPSSLTSAFTAALDEVEHTIGPLDLWPLPAYCRDRYGGPVTVYAIAQLANHDRSGISDTRPRSCRLSPRTAGSCWPQTSGPSQPRLFLCPGGKQRHCVASLTRRPRACGELLT